MSATDTYSSLFSRDSQPDFVSPDGRGPVLVAWDPQARGTIVGLSRGSNRSHLARAALEAMAFQTRDILEAMQDDAGIQLQKLKVDGGATVGYY